MISAARFPTAPLLSARPPAKKERGREEEREGEEGQRREKPRDLVSACTFTDFINQPVLPLCFERGGVSFKVNVLLRNRWSTTDTQQLEALDSIVPPSSGATAEQRTHQLRSGTSAEPGHTSVHH